MLDSIIQVLSHSLEAGAATGQASQTDIAALLCVAIATLSG